MAGLALIAQLFVDGVWTTYPGLSADGWEYQVGPDVETGTRPNRLAFSLNNADLSMDPSNVSSPLYGKIGRNTRARARINAITLTTVEASSWKPDATSEHIPTGSAGAPRGRAWTDLAGEGLLRRLGRWTDPIRSAMARQIVSYTSLTGYWPLEDPSGAAQLSNTLSGGAPGAYTGTVSLAGDRGAGGSDACITTGSDARLSGTFKTPAGNGYQISWVAKLSAMPTSATYLPLFTWTDTQRQVWEWSVNNTNFRWSITGADGTSIAVLVSPFGAGANPNQWIRYRMKVTVAGGTVTYAPAWYVQDASVSYGVSDTYVAASTARPARWTVTGNAWTDGAAFGHVLAVTDTTLDLTTGADAVKSFNGYLGEAAALRFYRLTGEEGLTRYILGDSASAAPMGRQKPGLLLELIEECVRSEAGLVYDEPADIALTFVTNRYMVNRPIAAGLTLAKSSLTAPLIKTIDDVGVINDVTVNNADGSSVNLTLDAGPLSVQPPPAGVGRVKGSIDVNLAAVSSLPNRANWELRKGTLDRPRYLQVKINLLQNPGLTNTITALRPGDWVALTGVEPDTVYLRVISYERTGGHVDDSVVLSCLPAEIYTCGVYDATSSRYDSTSTTLAAAITTTTQTAISLTTANYNDQWSTTAVPYDIKIGGERMTVTAMTAGAGTGPVTQTATVTRAVNGVTKTHLVSTEVHLFAQVRYALG